MSLIDVTSEDDLLIDSHLDRASFDLRLSIAYDASCKTPTSKDVDEHLNAGRKDEFKSRQSLAWDSAFFTSAGILDLRELSLVNDGFKNPEDQTSKICEKRRLACKLASGEGKASKSFLDFRVSGKHNLQSSKHTTREPKTNISLTSQTWMKYGQQVHSQMKIASQQSTRSSEMSSAQTQDRHLKPPKVQTRASSHVASAAKSPRSAFSKSIASANTGIVSSSSAEKRWLSKSLDFKGDNGKKIGDSPRKLVSIDCNVAQVSDVQGSRKPLHHENNQSVVGGNKAQMQSSTTRISAKAKRSLSPLPGDAMNSSKKPLRLCMSSHRFGLFDIDKCGTQSPAPRGRGIVKDCGASGGLKKGQRKTSTHSLTKKTRSADKDDEKENMFHVEHESFHGGLAKEKYVEITNLFDGLVIEPKGINRKKAATSRLVGSAPTLRPKTKQSSRVVEARDSAFRRSAFISLV